MLLLWPFLDAWVVVHMIATFNFSNLVDVMPFKFLQAYAALIVLKNLWFWWLLLVIGIIWPNTRNCLIIHLIFYILLIHYLESWLRRHSYSPNADIRLPLHRQLHFNLHLINLDNLIHLRLLQSLLHHFLILVFLKICEKLSYMARCFLGALSIVK